jgi:hypothetical protein
MDRSIDYVGALETKEDRKLVWARAKRVPWKVLQYRHGKTRRILWERWKTLLGQILFTLNNRKDKDFEKNLRLLRRYLDERPYLIPQESDKGK